MSKFAKVTILLMVSTIITKILGFGKELILASAYGASMYSDAYITAINIPQVIFDSIGIALGTIFIPMYFDIKKNRGEKQALNFTNNMFNIVIVLCIMLGLIGIIFTEELVKLFAVGFRGETLDVAIDFSRILMIGLIFTGISYIMKSYLQIKNNFTITGLINVPKNIIIIISIILSIKYGPYLMVWGTLIGIASEFIFQLPFALKEGYRYRFYIDLKDEYIKKTIILLGPVFIGSGVNQINNMVDRTLASTLAEGSISALNYAHKLNGFVMALFITSIGTVIYPMLSKLSSEDNKDKFIKYIVQSTNIALLLLIPISVGAIILSNPIVKLLFERGEFDSRATSMTSTALVMYSIGMVAYGLRDILGKVFYSLQDTKTPMINGALSMIMNIILNFILVKHFGLAGLALATSISAIICIILLFSNLRKKIGYFGQDNILKTAMKSVVATCIMGMVTNLFYHLLNEVLKNSFINNIISLSGAIIIGFTVYIIMVTLLKVEELEIIKNLINNKMKIKNRSTR